MDETPDRKIVLSRPLRYLFRFWGASEGDVEAATGLQPSVTYYCATHDELAALVRQVDLPEYRAKGLAVETECAASDAFTGLRTVATVTLAYRGRSWSFDYDAGYDYPEHALEYAFREGNYSCDCNRILFVARECAETAPAEWIAHERDGTEPCGDTIALTGLTIHREEGIRAMSDSEDRCPKCGSHDWESWVEEVDIGVGVQTFDRGGECRDCGPLLRCNHCGKYLFMDPPHHPWCNRPARTPNSSRPA